jgi:dipeptidyl aminopeptidase/acylaminoacyl peptidase
MSTADYVPELAAALDRLVPDDSLAPDWNDVVGRVGERRRRRTASRRVRLGLAVALVLLLLTGVATGTYLATRKVQPPPSVVALDEAGGLATLWTCPYPNCGGLTYDATISADGGRVAVLLDAFNGTGLYLGLHIIDLATGADRQLPPPPPDGATPAAHMRAFREHLKTQAQLLGCPDAHELALSPGGSRLAYACSLAGRIYVIGTDGTGRQRLQTGTRTAYWPTWSPDGSRIAFSTQSAPFYRTGPNTRSAIYVVGLDGSHRKLVARAGAAPDWSPDGKTIAYWAVGCTRTSSGRTRFVTPDGRDVTPHSSDHRCGGIGPGRVVGAASQPDGPIAAWASDGRKIAVRSGPRVYVMDADGSDVTAVSGTDGFGDSRPLWAPR